MKQPRANSIDNEAEDAEHQSDDAAMLRQRLELYPDLYKTEADVAVALSKYVVEIPVRRAAGLHRFGRKRQKCLEQLQQEKQNDKHQTDDNDDDEKSKSTNENNHYNNDPNIGNENSSNAASSVNMVVTRHAAAQVDIWGRIPPKEPKEKIDCPVCKQPVNSLARFAPHLDKCLGIGTLSRAAAAGSARNAAK